MTDREMDAVLGAESEIAPSPGFAANVMRAVHLEARRPAPIRFPWLLALPGLFAWGLTLLLVLAVPWYGSGAPKIPAFRVGFDFAWVRPAFDSLMRLQMGWIALGVLLTIICAGFPLRLIRRGTRG